jgi:hypothetical protein
MTENVNYTNINQPKKDGEEEFIFRNPTAFFGTSWYLRMETIKAKHVWIPLINFILKQYRI